MYLNLFFFQSEPFFDVVFQFAPKIESFFFQSRGSLQPLLKGQFHSIVQKSFYTSSKTLNIAAF